MYNEAFEQTTFWICISQSLSHFSENIPIKKIKTFNIL